MNFSSKLREQASAASEKAAVAKDDFERDMLLRKAEALLALAESEDWLEGKAGVVAESATDAMPHPGAAE